MLSITKNKHFSAAIIWICIIQFGFICGVEAVYVSIFTGTARFDSQYRYPTPGVLGLITALYPVFAGIGSLSTLVMGPYMRSRTILQVGSFIWLAGFLLGVFHLTLEGILGARAIKGFAIGLITSTLAPYIESVDHIVNPPRALTSFQGVVPFSLMVTSIVAAFLHHFRPELNMVEFNICWLISASPALPLGICSLLLPSRAAATKAKPGLWGQLLGLAKDQGSRKILKACFVQAGVQFTGVNVVLYYTSALCTMVGLSSERTRYVAIGLYGCNFVATLISVPLVDRLPLSKALKWSALGMAACHGAMFVCSRLAETTTSGGGSGSGVGIGCIAVCYVFMAIYSMFFNGISFVYTSALIPPSTKSLGVGLAIGVGWLVNAVLSAVVPLVMVQIRGTTFMLFNWFCCCLFISL